MKCFSHVACRWLKGPWMSENWKLPEKKSTNFAKIQFLTVLGSFGFSGFQNKNKTTKDLAQTEFCLLGSWMYSKEPFGEKRLCFLKKSTTLSFFGFSDNQFFKARIQPRSEKIWKGGWYGIVVRLLLIKSSSKLWWKISENFGGQH